MLQRNIKLFLILSFMGFYLSKAAYAETLEINFAYIGPPSHSGLSGVKQGLAEANLQGQFLGQQYKLDTFSVADTLTADLSGYIAIIAAVTPDEFIKLSDALPNVPLFNIALDNDSLRTSCLTNALHVIPSSAMKADALKQWHQKNANSEAVAQAWHGDFVKFAARDLNKRFKKEQNTVMDDYAWSGWAAVKMTSNSVARENISNAKQMLEYLKTGLSFDGQKGSDMTFRKTGQLRQLLLIVENDKIVEEAPIRGVAKPPTLDSLGLLNCEK